MGNKVIKVGSRDSALAMWQTQYVIDNLKSKTTEYNFEIVPIKAKGDKILDVALSKIGDKGLFTQELETAMLMGEIDLAVHSMKDMPTKLTEGLLIGAVMKRHDASDVLVSKNNCSLNDLPQGAKIGTSSLRRRSQLLHWREDLVIYDLRGNVETRLRKMTEENFDGIILAAAGIERLGRANSISEKIPFDICLPAVGQGAIGIEIRENDEEIQTLLRLINDEATFTAVRAERRLLGTLEGGCQIPIAAYGEISGDRLFLRGLVGSINGETLIKEQILGSVSEAEQLGEQLAQKLIEQGATEILSAIKKEMNQ